MRAYELEVPIYKQYLNVLIGDVFKSAESLMDEYNVDIGDAHHGAGGLFLQLTVHNEGSMYFLMIPEKCCAEVLAHESVHAACTILHNAGIDITFDNQEAVAYLTGYFVEEVGKILIDKPKPRKKKKK